jgi:hypothetical protein
MLIRKEAATEVTLTVTNEADAELVQDYQEEAVDEAGELTVREKANSEVVLNCQEEAVDEGGIDYQGRGKY